jgi:hypothetical protein
MCLKSSLTVHQLLTDGENLQIVGQDDLAYSEVTRPGVIGYPLIRRSRLRRAQYQFMCVDEFAEQTGDRGATAEYLRDLIVLKEIMGKHPVGAIERAYAINENINEMDLFPIMTIEDLP